MKTLKVLTLLVLFWALTSTASAVPTVDGEFDPYNEYTGPPQTGDFSSCWSYNDGGDLYIFNDWFTADENYDPATDDDYNIFTWDGVANWRLKVRADGTGIIQRNIGGVWTDQSPGDLEEESNYTTTPDHIGVCWPVWEIKIPAELLEETTGVNPNDPKQGGDSDDDDGPCGGWDTTAMDFGTAPTISLNP